MYHQTAQEWLEKNVPKKPYCCDDLATGVRILPLASAIRKKYIQINPPNVVAAMLFDIDYAGAMFAAADADLPPPTFCTCGTNRRGHLVYALSTPVSTSPRSRIAPQRYLAAIRAAYTLRLGADAAYSGLLTKNPVNTHWDCVYDGNAVYDLEHLASFVSLSSAKLRSVETEYALLGRNCALFEAVRKWAYRAVRTYWAPEGYATWEKAVQTKAAEQQSDLPSREISAVARSIAKWTWRHMSPASFAEYVEQTHTTEIQRRRVAKRWNDREKNRSENEKAAIAMIEAGISTRDIVIATGVAERTIERWKKNNALSR